MKRLALFAVVTCLAVAPFAPAQAQNDKPGRTISPSQAVLESWERHWTED